MTSKKKLDIVISENPPELPTPPEKRSGGTELAGKSEAYSNHQLDLFQTFLCNTELEKKSLSNTLHFWDSVPRYSISRKEMNKRRDEKGNLPSLHLSFEFHGQPYTVKIHPARIDDGDKSIEYYPSANEELVEDALRKLATRQGSGFFEKSTMRSGVAFTLYELREELAARGHARSFQEIIEYLTILQRSHIEIRTGEGKGESFVASNYLPALAAVSRKKLLEDSNAKWLAQFHPLVSQCIDQLTYRQFNYQTMMELPTQLARWIHKLLSIKFTFASIVGNPFELHYNTIKRDSNLLNCERDKDNRREVENAFTRLIESNVLREVQKSTIKGGRGKTLDVVYQLYPSVEFIKEMKASNKRKR